MVDQVELVERVARRLAMFMVDTWGDAEGVVWAGLSGQSKVKATQAARAALEASHHADLVEALRIIADEQSWRGFSPAAIVERMRDLARAKLPHPNNTGEV